MIESGESAVMIVCYSDELHKTNKTNKTQQIKQIKCGDVESNPKQPLTDAKKHNSILIYHCTFAREHYVVCWC